MSILVGESTGGAFPRYKQVRRIPSSQKGGHEVVEVPEQVREQMRAALPKVVRRDPRERYRSMLTRISEEALASYRTHGTIVWPKSAWDELKTIAWKTGDPHLTDLGGEEQLRKQIQALTRQVVETTENQQKAQDAKRVTTGWHGH